MSVTTKAVATCPMCSGPAAPRRELDPLPIVTCERCSFSFRPDLLDTQLTKELYEGGRYEQTHASAKHDDPQDADRLAYARIRARWVAARIPPTGTLVDVGAAGGSFVLAAKEAGFDASGIEPVAAFADPARETLGVEIRAGRVEDIQPESADVLSLWHVLEHLPDPRAGLQQLRAGLRPGGHLVLEVPNLSSLPAKMQGTSWTHLDVETHVSHFTPDTLRAALVAAELAPIVEVTVSHGSYLSAAQRRAPRHLVSRAKLAAGALRHGRRGDPWRDEFLRVIARRDV